MYDQFTQCVEFIGNVFVDFPLSIVMKIFSKGIDFSPYMKGKRYNDNSMMMYYINTFIYYGFYKNEKKLMNL